MQPKIAVAFFWGGGSHTTTLVPIEFSVKRPPFLFTCNDLKLHLPHLYSFLFL